MPVSVLQWLAVAVCVTSAVPVSVSTQYLHNIYTISTQYLHSIYTVDIQYEQWFHLSLVGTRTGVDKTRNVCQLGGWLLGTHHTSLVIEEFLEREVDNCSNSSDLQLSTFSFILVDLPPVVSI